MSLLCNAGGDGVGVLAGRFGCLCSFAGGRQYLGQARGQGAAARFGEDTEDMNRERAETYLRRLAEAELRRARTLPAALFPARQDTARLTLVAQALVAVGAVDAGTADEIRADLQLAVAVRQPGQVNQASRGQRGPSPDKLMRLARLMHSPPRAATGALPVSGPSTAHTRPAPPRASWRAVPVGQVIRIREDDVRRELLVVAYVQSADGARFTTAGWPFRPFTPFTAADDRGASHQISFGGEMRPRELLLRPDPLHQIRWLDLIMAPGEPAIRIDLDPPIPAPQVTVTRNATSPGELLLDVIAARILTWAGASPPDNARQPAAADDRLRALVCDGPGDIVAALHAAAALSRASRVPGQLAGLCARLSIRGHGITAPPADDLPERWRSMLTSYHRLEPQAGPAPGILAATVAKLPELDGAQIAILGLHHGERGTIVHLLASGVTLESDWQYARPVRPLPALWIRDSSGRWHTTSTNGVSPMWGDPREVMLWLAIIPPLDRGTAWIDVVATGSSAEVRARLPLSWE